MRLATLSISLQVLLLKAPNAIGKPLVSGFVSEVLADVKSDNLMDLCQNLRVAESVTLKMDYEPKDEAKILGSIKARWSDYKQSSQSIPGTDRTLLQLRKEHVATAKPAEELSDASIAHLKSAADRGWEFLVTEPSSGFARIEASLKNVRRNDVIATYSTFANGILLGHIDVFEMNGVYGQPEYVQFDIGLNVKLVDETLLDRVMELANKKIASADLAAKANETPELCRKPTKKFKSEGFVRTQDQVAMTRAFRDSLLTERFSEELKGVKFSANLVAEKVDGFKIDTLHRDSILCLSGFQVGDVLKMLQGKVLKDAPQAISLINEIRNADRIVIAATREGKAFSTLITVGE